MAVTKRYPRTLPASCTEDQYAAVEADAAGRKPYPISMAEVLRELVDERYGLKDGQKQ